MKHLKSKNMRKIKKEREKDKGKKDKGKKKGKKKKSKKKERKKKEKKTKEKKKGKKKKSKKKRRIVNKDEIPVYKIRTRETSTKITSVVGCSVSARSSACKLTDQKRNKKTATMQYKNLPNTTKIIKIEEDYGKRHE